MSLDKSSLLSRKSATRKKICDLATFFKVKVAELKWSRRLNKFTFPYLHQLCPAHHRETRRERSRLTSPHLVQNVKVHEHFD